MKWMSNLRLPYLAEVDIKPPPDTNIRKLDCEFETLAEAVDWIYNDNPRRLGARIYRGQWHNRYIRLDLVWKL